MKPTEQTKRHVIATYVQPARRRGAKTIQVRVGNVQKELGWTNRTPSVFSTLLSKEFQKEAGLQLQEKIGGPASGGPSTTVELVYQLVGDESGENSPPIVASKGKGLLGLYGLCKEMYEEVGGGEKYIRSLRDNFGSIVPDKDEADREKNQEKRY